MTVEEVRKQVKAEMLNNKVNEVKCKIISKEEDIAECATRIDSYLEKISKYKNDIEVYYGQIETLLKEEA